MFDSLGLLIVTYYWPPSSGPGVQRWLKFAKYFSALGVKVNVLTVMDGTYPSLDKSLLDEVPDLLRVSKTKTFEVYKVFNRLKGKKDNSVDVGLGDLTQNSGFLNKVANFTRSNIFIPDGRVAWKYFAIPKAIQLIEKNELNFVITTGPPQSTHLIGLALKKKYKNELKWIIDFRDPWVNIYYNKHLKRLPFAQRMDQRFESQSVQNADQVVVVNNGLKEEFEDRAKRIKVITNGWDNEDFPEQIYSKKESSFVISFTGNMGNSYDNDSIWKAISKFTKSIPSANIKLRITGHLGNKVRLMIENEGLLKNLEESGFVSHKEAIRRMIHSDLLLLPIPPSNNSDRIVPGKIFEYLASGTAILGLGPTEGAASKILIDCHRQPMVGFTDIQSIFNRLQYEYERWSNALKSRVKYDGKEHYKYSRKHLAIEYLKTLTELKEKR